MTASEWGMLCAVTPLVGTVRVGLSLLPFRTLVRLLRRGAGVFGSKRPADDDYMQRMTWAVSAVGRRLLGERPCLTEALVVQYLLQRRGRPATLEIGVDKDEDGVLLAHAWVESNGQIVIGGAISDQKYHRLQDLEQKLH